VGDETLNPAAGEDLSYLLGDWRIFQRLEGHRWSLDDLVTAWYAARACDVAPAAVLDLGTGIGSILLMLAWRFPEARLVGVEAQPASAALARRSIRYNGIEDRCHLITQDLREVRLEGRFELVTASPPYFPRGSVASARDAQCRACREEERGSVADYLEVAAAHLAPGGRVVACFAAPQRARLEVAAEGAGLRTIAWCEVHGKVSRPARIVVAAFERGSGTLPPPDPPVAVRDRMGQWTAALRALRREMGMPDEPPGR
jgi:tRNA1(Val) A37 N6-methylase TrmN6